MMSIQNDYFKHLKQGSSVREPFIRYHRKEKGSLPVRVSRIQYKGEDRIALQFSYDEQLVDAIRKIPGRRWSNSLRCWHVPDSEQSYTFLRQLLTPRNSSVDNTTSTAPTEKPPLRKGVSIEVCRRENLILLRVPQDSELLQRIRFIRGAEWRPGIKKWMVPGGNENYKYLSDILKDSGYAFTTREIESIYQRRQHHKPRVSRENVPLPYLNQLKLQNKSPRTIEIYSAFIAQFLHHFRGLPIGKLPAEEIRKYILQHREEGGYSEAYQSQMVSALKSYYRIVFDREFPGDSLPRPQKARSLPKVLSKEEINRMITLTVNQKHRLIILFLYGCGMRVGEVVRLRTRDLESDRRLLMIRRSKGSKDRTVPLPRSLEAVLKAYLKSYRPVEYFIEGVDGKPYSATSIRNIVRGAATRAGIKQQVTPHMLRHSYATHMLERGVDLRYIQDLLGHKSSRTTEIYTHISNRKLDDIGSPLDDLDID